jgi:predicted nucleic acid-binding protein
MILPDTNIWIDHLHRPDQRLTTLLLRKRIRIHPFVIGEIALGLSGSLGRLIASVKDIRQSTVADADELLSFIQDQELNGTGIGYVDAHLLASARLMPSGRLWTRDKKLHAQAERLGLAYPA